MIDNNEFLKKLFAEENSPVCMKDKFYFTKAHFILLLCKKY